jgi:inactivated superfamily I helicase/RecB family exonuclease
MPITRVFLDWRRPALPAVVGRLIEKYGSDGEIDLSRVIVVVPGRRAGRRLRELLTERTAGRCLPPRIITLNDLPELLYEPKLPFASDLVQKLAWAEALRSMGAGELQSLVRALPAAGDAAGWLALAELLWQQHRNLAGDGLDFADVVRLGPAVAHFDELPRWQVLREVQQRYLRILDGLGLWDVQTARRVAVEKREFQCTADVVLVGTIDLNRLQRHMLDQVADRVTAIIHAPPDRADWFDEHGCVVPERWEEAAIDFEPDQLTVVAGPLEQAEAVALRLGALNGNFRADEITIGLTSDPLAAPVQRVLAECGVASRWVVGRPLIETAPCRLLAAVADCLEDDRTPRFAALVRHPDVSAWLIRQKIPDEWLRRLDTYIEEHVPQRMTGRLQDSPAVFQVRQTMQALLSPLKRRTQPLSAWSGPLAGLLRTVYDDVEFDPSRHTDRTVVDALEMLQEVLREHTAVPESLSPTLGAAAALRMLLRELEGETAAPPADDAAIDLLGWLELPLDDAPVLVLAGMNEGLVPESVNADPFLPDRLRSALGLLDNRRRYARDAYALTSLLHSRERISLIAARRDPRGDPLAPSRLLLAAQPETVARRVLAFYRPAGGEPPPLAGIVQTARDKSGFAVPRPPQVAAPPDSVSVTAFRDYLASPYRFYLKHVARLETVHDGADELTAMAFGNLAHEALKRFGRSELHASTDAEAIHEFLAAALSTIATETYGSERMMAIEIQLKQAEVRLRAFAAWEAEWARQGWRIVHTEVSSSEGVEFDLGDGRSIRLKGRIDRIDCHEETGAWTIFDYKTGESSESPDKAHRSGDDWHDLQLPLYRHLAAPLGVTGDVRLGYIRLPRDTNQVGALIAEWTADDLAQADDVARDVARRILNGEYWQVLDQPPGTLDEFDPICQEGVFDREAIV